MFSSYLFLTIELIYRPIAKPSLNNYYRNIIVYNIIYFVKKFISEDCFVFLFLLGDTDLLVGDDVIIEGLSSSSLLASVETYSQRFSVTIHQIIILILT